MPRKLLHGQWTIDLDTRATIAHIDLDSQGLFVDWAVQYFLNHTKQIACAFAGEADKKIKPDLIVQARLVEIPGKLPGNDLYSYVYVFKYRIVKVELGKTIGVEIREGSIAEPAAHANPHCRPDLLKPAVTPIPIEQTGLGPLRMQVSLKGVGQRPMKSSRPEGLGRVDPHVGHEEIQ